MYFVRCLLLIFANSLDLDQVLQNIGPGLDLNWYSDNIHENNFESNILQLYQQTTKSNENYPAWKEPTQYISSVDYNVCI